MASIQRHGKRWRARWRAPDKRQHSRVFDRKADAERFLAQVEASKLNGSYIDQEAGARTIAEFVPEWITTRHSSKGEPLRVRTRESYDYLFRMYIDKSLGGYRLRDVTPSVVSRWYSELPNGSTRPKAYRLLRAVMNTAVAEEMILRNPCRVSGGGIERSRERPIPSSEEVWALADAVPRHFRAMVLTAAFVGLRFGELAGLTREDIDLSGARIHVRRQLVQSRGGSDLAEPKTASGVRSVDVPPVLLPVLREHLAAHVAAEPGSPVFRGARGGILTRRGWSVVWGRARDAVGCDPNIRLHDLRHYSATLTAASGASLAEIMKRLGHSSPAAAMRYQHATAEEGKRVAERMNALITGDAMTPRRLHIAGS